MDELEFRKRIYANPRDLDQEVLAAAQGNADYRKILDETLGFEDSLEATLNHGNSPEGLLQQLLSIPESDEIEPDIVAGANVQPLRPRKQNFFQYYAIAASLILAVGIVFSVGFNESPSANEIFGDELIAHLYHELDLIDNVGIGGDSIATLDLEAVNSSMAETGTRLASFEASSQLGVVIAKPCKVLAAYESAHLFLQGSHGAINVILINNTPVDVQFTISDERFEGVVMPMDQGNLILVGEKNEDLTQFASLLSQSVERII